MGIASMIGALDAEIAQLEEARRLLSGISTGAKRGRGGMSGGGKSRRPMSVDGRARIAAAQKARWAKAKTGK